MTKRHTYSFADVKRAKLSDIKVGDRISLRGGTGIVVQRTRGAEQIEVISDHNGRRVWIVDAKFWFERGELKKEAAEDLTGAHRSSATPVEVGR